MKIRNPRLIRWAGWLGSWALRGWMGTVPYHYCPLGPYVAPDHADLPGRYIYVFWHENFLLPAFRYDGRDSRVLISQHADGEVLAEMCRHLGIGTVRGSATRGGVEGLWKMLDATRLTHLVITPDGPRGPRRVVKPGVVYLAARSGLPIVPVGIGFRRPWRLNSWDRFILPRPFASATAVTFDPIRVPPEVNREQMELYRQKVEQDLLEAGEVAEHWAETGERPTARRSSPVADAPAA